MSETGAEIAINTTENNPNKTNFLKATETSKTILNGLKLEGFMLGGGAVDFALGHYRRPHADLDVIYVVDSISWGEYLKNPKSVPAERESLHQIIQEPELAGIKQVRPPEMEKMDAPGIRMEGGEFPITVDFIEAYRDRVREEEFIMLPLFEGDSYTKIPLTEIQIAEIDGVKTMVPSAEVQYLLKKQMADPLTTWKVGLPPDQRDMAKTDMEDLRKVVDTEKLKSLRTKGVGLNYKIPGLRFIPTRLGIK